MSTRYFKDMLLYWAIPPGFRDLIKRSIRSLKKSEKHISSLCSPNIAYKNIHHGQRCFIVCSGPSIKKQNLLPLKNEVTFFVSTGFLHPDYSAIQPDYHCVPDIQLTPKLTGNNYVGWFKLMDRNIGNTRLFLSAADENFIKQNDLFSTRQVSYLNMGLDWYSCQKTIYDITKKIPVIQSVPIMAIMIAMYMGCKEIYLLGVELDEIWCGEYRHFYDNEIMANDIAVNEDGRSITPLIEMFKVNYTLWRQFDLLRRIAEANNIEILNATQGGALDIYKRVKLEDLFN
jgi:hypothetical protein